MDSFLKRYYQKRKIVLCKGENLHNLITLVWNRVLMLKLQIHKWIHGIHHPIVHYYAVCWNEEKLLPFMFDYYRQFVDHFTIYDNYSDDHSDEIIRLHKNADIIKFKTDGFDDTIHAQIKNNCWKKSRGKADYVIVCDVDEFIYHSQIKSFINMIMKQKITLPTPIGYSMYAESFPEYSKDFTIIQLVRKGVRDNYYSKNLLFDPHRVVEINYTAGSHVCHPVGKIVKGDEYKVLHYKNMDIEAVIARNRVYAERLSTNNIIKKFGVHYLRDEEKIRSNFEQNLKKSEVVID